MAKYNIIHSCGHTVEHELFGKHTGFGGRDSKIEWLGTVPCCECRRKQVEEGHAAQSREAAAGNLQMGCIPLVGSEKQVAWAETIRRRALVALTGALDRVRNAPESMRNLEVERCIKSTISWLMGKSESQWWIETIGTLKSRDGMAPIFGLLDGKQPAASEREILNVIMLESPETTESAADAIGLGESFRARVAARAAEAAKSEMKKQLEASRPARPQVLADARARFGDKYYWNGKIYSGPRIYVSETEIKLTREQETEIKNYQVAFAAWNSKMKLAA